MGRYADDVAALKQDDLRISLYNGTRTAPDLEAKLQTLSERTGIPVESIRRDPPEFERRERLEAFDIERVATDNPHLSAWLTEPQNAAVAHDDFDSLSGMEKLLTAGRDVGGAVVKGVIGQGAGATLSGFGEMYNVGARSLMRPLSAVLPQGAVDALNTEIPWWLNPGEILKRPGGELKQAGEWMGAPKERQTLATDVTEGVGQLGFQVAAYLMTGGASSTSMLFAQGVDIMAEKTANDVADPSSRDTAIIGGGAITALAERYGLGKILNRVPANIRNRTLRFIADKLAAGGIEAAQELTEGLLHDVSRRVLTNNDAPVLDGIGREMTAAAGSAALVRAALGVRGFRHAQQTEDFITALGDNAKASKLRERLPERYKSLIERYTKDGPLQNVMVPADKFVEYFQTAGIPPEIAAEQFGVVNFTEAVAANSDVVISMADFVAKIAPSDHLQGLMQDIRLIPGEDTIREAREHEANREASEAKLREDLAAFTADLDAGNKTAIAIERVVTDVEGQLRGRYDPETSRAMANAMRGAAVLAQRAYPDMDPMQAAEQLWGRYGLTIRANPLPDVLTKAPDFDAAIDPLLDRLRAGDIPKQTEAFGPSLFDFLREKGGIKDRGGELAARDAVLSDRETRLVGQRRLVNPEGMDFDLARELASGVGYPVGELESSFFEAFDRELGGDAVYSTMNEKPGTVGLLHDLDDMRRLLDDMGIDIGAADNATIKAALHKELGGKEFDQAAFNGPETGNTPIGDLTEIEVDGVQRPALNSNGQPIHPTQEGVRNFWRWFGDSKVVDADGKPLVVYHGTNTDFVAFDSLKTKGQTGNHTALLGFFFSPSAQEASRYGADFRGKHGGNVMPVYLKIDDIRRIPYKQMNDIAMASFSFDATLPDNAYKTPEGMAKIRAARERADQMAMDLRTDMESEGHTGAVVKINGHDEYIAFYPDQIKSATGNRGTFDPKSGNILHQKTAGNAPRGSLQIGADRKMRINLLEKADLSTFLHEAGHFYLEVLGDLAEDASSSQQVRDDYAAILKFLGAADRAGITRDMHEKWADANLNYLMEGKAPAPELRGVFQRFAAWLNLLFRKGSFANIKLTDEVRGVLDRIYATDEEIARVQAEAGLQDLFVDAKTAGLSEAEFDVYRAAIAEQTVEGKDELQAKLMRIERLKRETWWKDELAHTRKEVAAEYDAAPAGEALERMSRKGATERLSRAQLLERYGPEILKRLPRGYGDGRGAVYVADGRDIDAMAEVMGFGSVNDMVEALAALPPRSQYIAAEADQRMGERYGDLLNSVEIADAAMEALHNDKREAVLQMELRALNRAIKADMPPASAFRDMAAGLIGQKQVRDISPYTFLLAERKANREALRQMMEGGNRLDAFRAKQRELLNHYLYKEATRAKAEARKIAEYLKGFGETKKRQALAQAGGEYLAQITALLERYEFSRASLKSLERRESLAAWLNKLEADGEAVAVDDLLRDETRKPQNWQQVPMDELRALRDAVKNIDHLARYKNKLIRKRKALDFGQVVAELVNAVNDSGLSPTGELDRFSDKGVGIKEQAAKAWRRFDAEHLKIEQLVEWLDGGKGNGPWARYFFDLADDAQTTEYDIHEAVTTKIQELNEAMPKAWRASLFDELPARLPGMKRATRYDLISIALNMGNDGNLQRLRDGFGWSDMDLSAIRGLLTADDMRFVQGMWDAIETLWPHMAALEERSSGLPPPKIEATPLTVAGQTWRGGYFPAVYDSKKSTIGERQIADDDKAMTFFSHGFGRPGTSRGATKARAEKVSQPLLIDYEHVLSGHLAKVIKDISHREAVIGMHKILTNAEVKQALIERAGEARYQQMRNWLQSLVSDRSDSLQQSTGWTRNLMKLRTNMAIVTMGWKISTSLVQIAGFGPSLDVVRPQFMAKALLQATKNPRETWALVAGKSGEMRHRSNTIDRDAKDSLLRMRGGKGFAADVRRTAFYLTAMADRAVSVPTWLGGYMQSLAEGKAEEDAIRAGDRAVRLSQGAGGAKDLSAVQRSNELMKLLTMYYTPFNVMYARLRDVGHQFAVKKIGYLPKASARLIALVILPAVMGEMLAMRGPDEDEDGVWWAMRKALLYPLASIPVIRDLSGVLEAALIEWTGDGEMKYQPSYRLSPVLQAAEKITKILGIILDAADGETEPQEAAWDLWESSGYVTGLPTAQTRITGEYLVDLLTGDADPENAPELLRDALFRRHKDDK